MPNAAMVRMLPNASLAVWLACANVSSSCRRRGAAAMAFKQSRVPPRVISSAAWQARVAVPRHCLRLYRAAPKTTAAQPRCVQPHRQPTLEALCMMNLV